MAKSNVERQKEYHKRKEASGYVRRQVWIPDTPTANASLNAFVKMLEGNKHGTA